MTAQEAILEIVTIFDEGNREIEEVLAIHGMHSLKAGELIPKIEKSIMYRVGEVVRQYEKAAEIGQSADSGQSI